MLKALFKKQLQQFDVFFFQSGKKGVRRSKGAVIGFALLMVYLYGSICFLFYGMAGQLCSPLAQADMGWLYFSLMTVTATACGILGSVFTTYSSLYTAKDNDLLLSLPIPPGNILISRLFGIYIMAALFELVVMIPACVAYWQTVGFSVYSLLMSLIGITLLPFVAVALSCLLGWVIALIAPRVPCKNLVITLFSLGFLVLYYICFFKANDFIQSILLNTELVGYKMRVVLYPFFMLGKAMVGDFFAILTFAIIIGVICLLIYFLLSRSFLKMSTVKRSARVSYRDKDIPARTVTGTLFHKELNLFGRSSTYMLNCGLGSVIMLAGAVFIGIKWQLINTFAGMISIPFPLLVFGAVCLVASMNVVTAPSISLEAHTLWLLQSLPVRPQQVLAAKIKLHLAVTAIPAVICAVVCDLAIGCGWLFSCLVPLSIVLFILLNACLGLFFNLKWPSLDWNSETAAVKQSFSVVLSIFANWAIVGLFFLMWLLLPVNTIICLLLMDLLMIILTALLFFWLGKRGTGILASL